MFFVIFGVHEDNDSNEYQEYLGMTTTLRGAQAEIRAIKKCAKLHKEAVNKTLGWYASHPKASPKKLYGVYKNNGGPDTFTSNYIRCLDYRNNHKKYVIKACEVKA